MISDVEDSSQQQELYRTKDLPEAAFLYASGQKLIKADFIDSKCWFFFSNKEGCEQLVTSFWMKKAGVDALTYSEALSTLKNILYSRERVGVENGYFSRN